METGYVLMTTIDGIDMFYGTCDVEGDIIEPGLISAFMTNDSKELNYILKILNRADGLQQPSSGIFHNNPIEWSIKEIEVRIK